MGSWNSQAKAGNQGWVLTRRWMFTWDNNHVANFIYSLTFLLCVSLCVCDTVVHDSLPVGGASGSSWEVLGVEYSLSQNVPLIVLYNP